MPSYTYRCEYVRCGKSRCKSCPHGPYWYGYWREGERVRKRYFGRKDPRPADARDGSPATPHPDDDIFDRLTASVHLARRILGLPADYDHATARRGYLGLVMTTHPDRGGTTRAFERVEAAWSYLKGVHGWR